MNTSRQSTPRLCVAVLLLVLPAASGTLTIAGWPQFMGPERSGVSPETGLAREWPATGPPLLWSIPVGPGYGGAAVQDGKVFLLDRIADEADVLRCLDLQTGREEWRFAYSAPGRMSFPGSRTTPAIKGDLVFIQGAYGHLHAVDRHSGQPLWRRNITMDYRSWQTNLSYSTVVPLDSEITRNVKAEILLHNTVPKNWLFAGPFAIGGTDELPPFFTNHIVSSGMELSIAGETHAVKSLPEQFVRGSGESRTIDVFGPIDGQRGTDTYYYTLIYNNFHRTVRTTQPKGGVAVWLGGIRIEDNEALHLDVGIYPLAVRVRLPASFPLNEWVMHPRLRDTLMPNEGQLPRWGITQNPLVHAGRLFVAVHTQQHGMLAIDSLTGETIWTSPFIGWDIYSHSSPMIARLAGIEQVVMLANATHGGRRPALISGIAADSGNILWQYTTPHPYGIPIPAAVQLDEATLLIAGGYRNGAFGLRITPAAPEWQTEMTFHNTACTPQIQTPVYHKGYIYAQSFDEYHNEENTGLVCMDTAGNLLWQSGPEQLFDSGALLIADGLIYVMHGKTGELHLIEATPDEFRPLARAKVLEASDGHAWAPMALSDGRLIIRDQNAMRCIDVSKGIDGEPDD